MDQNSKNTADIRKWSQFYMVLIYMIKITKCASNHFFLLWKNIVRYKFFSGIPGVQRKFLGEVVDEDVWTILRNNFFFGYLQKLAKTVDIKLTSTCMRVANPTFKIMFYVPILSTIGTLTSELLTSQCRGHLRKQMPVFDKLHK